MDRAHNLLGVIASEPHYTKQYGSNYFPPPEKKLYDNSIAQDSKTSKVRKAEANHTANKTDCVLYYATNKGCV